MKQKIFSLLTLLIVCVTGAWAESVTFEGGTGTGQINVSKGDGSQELASTPVTLNINNPGGKSQNRQIWKDGSTAKNEYAFQLSNSAQATPNDKYVEVSVAAGYKITSVTLRAVNGSGTSAGTIYGYCFEGAFSTASGAVKGVGSFAVPGNAGTSDGANVEMSTVAANTRTIRIYKQVKYDSSTNTINGTDGSNNPSSSATSTNIAKITVTYEEVPTYAVTYVLNGGNYDGSVTAPTQVAVTAGTVISLPRLIPTKTNYVFTGWLCNIDDEIYPENASYTMTASTTTFTAQWASAYNVTYSSTKGSAPSDESDVAFVELEEITGVDGWKNTGWIADQDVTVDESTVSTGTEIACGKTAYLSANTTFTAQWSAAYSVSFNSNGGTTVATQTVLSGNKASAPTAPTRSYWTFSKWQLDGSDYDFASTNVTSDITLDAVWTSHTATGAVTEEVIVDGTKTKSVALTNPEYGYSSSYTSEGDYVLAGGMYGGTSGNRYIKFTIPAGYTGVAYLKGTKNNDRKLVLISETTKTTHDNASGTTQAQFNDASECEIYISLSSSTSTADATSGTLSAGDYWVTASGGGLNINSLIVTLTQIAAPTITFKNGIATYTTKTGNNGENLGNLFDNNTLPSLAKTGCIFNGWKDSEDNAVTASSTISGDMFIYADWSYTLEVSDAGWASLYLDFAAKVPTGATAYYASSKTASTITFAPIGEDEVIPAGTGVVVNASEGNHIFSQSAADAENITSLLSGSITATAVEARSVYVLSKDAEGVCFADFTGTSVPAYRAYLEKDGSPAPSIRIILGENNATSIHDPQSSNEAVKFFDNGQIFIFKNGITYDLLGRVVR